MRKRSLRNTILLLVIATVTSSVEGKTSAEQNHDASRVQLKDHNLPVKRYEAGSGLHKPQELLDDPLVWDHPSTSRRVLNTGGQFLIFRSRRLLDGRGEEFGRRLSGDGFGPDRGGGGKQTGGRWEGQDDDDDDDDNDDDEGSGGGGGGGDGFCIGYCPGGGNGGGGGGGGRGAAAATTHTTNTPSSTPSTSTAAAPEGLP